MIHAAIVEDEQKAADKLISYLRRLEEMGDEQFDISHFLSPDAFFFSFQSQYDLIFMDIQLPGMNGMKAAEKLRELDQVAALVFVTNLSRYAINGYEVGALDYILKPLDFDAFRLKMRKVLRYCHGIERQGRQLTLPTGKGELRIPLDELLFVEITGHDMIFHTSREDITSYGTMKALEQELSPHGFFRCNNCYLVNLRYVRKVEGFTVLVHDAALSISHPRKKAFMAALAQFNP